MIKFIPLWRQWAWYFRGANVAAKNATREFGVIRLNALINSYKAIYLQTEANNTFRKYMHEIGWEIQTSAGPHRAGVVHTSGELPLWVVCGTHSKQHPPHPMAERVCSLVLQSNELRGDMSRWLQKTLRGAPRPL